MLKALTTRKVQMVSIHAATSMVAPKVMPTRGDSRRNASIGV